jgi:hypothetical protein
VALDWVFHFSLSFSRSLIRSSGVIILIFHFSSNLFPTSSLNFRSSNLCVGESRHLGFELHQNRKLVEFSPSINVELSWPHTRMSILKRRFSPRNEETKFGHGCCCEITDASAKMESVVSSMEFLWHELE